MSITCETCRHYAPLDPTQGTCRESPPIVQIIMTQTTRVSPPSPQTISAWPSTQPDNWCGRYAVKPPLLM